jgi:hypothetical protein
MAQPTHKSVGVNWWQRTRRYAAYSALALCCIGSAGNAGERYGQWSLESQEEGIVAFSFKGFIAELAFVCNQESKYVVVIIAPSPGTFKNQQESISVAIQETEDGYDSFDLLQRWENEGEYIFSEMPDEQEQLASYLRAREGEGAKSVDFSFPNDVDGSVGRTSRIVIDLAGFSNGIAAFTRECQ